ESRLAEPGLAESSKTESSKAESGQVKSSEVESDQGKDAQVESFVTALPEAVGQSRTEVVQEKRISSILLLQQKPPRPAEPPKDIDQSQAKAAGAKSNCLESKSVPNRLNSLLVGGRNAMLEGVNQLIRLMYAAYW